MDEDFKIKYMRLSEKVKVMIATQKEYFRTKKLSTLHKCKALEKEVDEMINPKPSSQAKIEWLAQ